MVTSIRDKYDAIIIGAGPAGMMAAITAAQRGRKILLLEKMPQAGVKLLISGKGRCNLTNAGGIDKFLKKFSASGIFLRNAFARFFNDDLCAFFQEAGCKLKTERGERVFPASDSSRDILNVLTKRLKENRVEIKYDKEVKDVVLDSATSWPRSNNKNHYSSSEPERSEGESRSIKSVIISDGNRYSAPKIVLATGGLSYPATGSTGFGLRIAQKLGHTVVAPKPGLVPVVTMSDMPGKLAGLSLENIKCSVIVDGKLIDERLGDMLFTHFGLSGPVILDLSADIYDLVESGKEVFVSINLKPGLDEKRLNARLQREFMAHPSKSLKNIFIELLPQRLISEFLKYCRIEETKRANQITKEERAELVRRLFDFRFQISGTKPIKDAIITRGGVSTKQINPKTMESKLVKGLYFAGELIDVDAKTGGYNLQAAFSTGYVCGENL